MKLTKFQLTREAIRSVANSGDIGASRGILKAAEGHRNLLRLDIEKNPRRDDKNLKNDVTYKLGQLNILNWIIDLPREAQNLIENSEGE